MKNCKGDNGPYISVPLAFFSFLLRNGKAREITELLVFEESFHSYGYYKCPRCGTSMEREFMSYCDRCGQKLSWKNYKKAKVVYPGERHR